MDIWLLSMADRKPIPYLQTDFNELHGQVSPDGQWLAYTSDESGTWEVYVQSFPVLGHRRTISTNGGAQPRWRKDGKELFYLASDRRLMTVRSNRSSTPRACSTSASPSRSSRQASAGPSSVSGSITRWRATASDS